VPGKPRHVLPSQTLDPMDLHAQKGAARVPPHRSIDAYVRRRGIRSPMRLRSSPTSAFMNRTAAALSLAIALTACATRQPQYSLEGSSVRLAKADAERAYANRPWPTVAAGEMDTPPKQLSFVLPSYPQELVNANIAGRVSVQFYIEPDGTVSNATVLGSPPSELEAITLQAMMQWRFSPAMKDGKPIRMKAVQTFRFKAE
jgi:TonB family protein